MKKIKQFFKDVIGEIREPSEDAGKVLGVIQRVIRVALFVSVCFTVVKVIYSSIGTMQMMKVNSMSFEEMIEFRGIIKFIVPYIRELINLVIGIVLCLFCNKSIKENKKISSNLFIVLLAIYSLNSFIFRLILDSSIIFAFQNLTSAIVIACIIGSAFIRYNKSKRQNRFSEEQTRLMNISILSYSALFFSIIPNIFIFAVTFQENISSAFEYIKDISEIGFMGYIYSFVNISMQFYTFIIFCILICILISRFNFSKPIIIIRNILFVICIIMHISLLSIGLSLSPLLYLIVYFIATGYQNKYKVFDNIGTRTFKKAIEKIKTGFDNYLSVGK